MKCDVGSLNLFAQQKTEVPTFGICAVNTQWLQDRVFFWHVPMDLLWSLHCKASLKTGCFCRACQKKKKNRPCYAKNDHLKWDGHI